MKDRAKSITRRALTLVVVAVGVVAIAGTALAGHQTSGVKSYTGCLVSGDGVLIKIKEGNTPKSACSGGQVEAHFSGGDITKISVGNGLTSTPNPDENGEVRIELAAGQTLPSGCTAGRVAEWNGSAWVCGDDNDTTYSASTGLDLSAGNAFSIEPAYRLPSKACTTAGEFARGFDATGNIQCQAPAPASNGVEVWQKTTGSVIDLPNGEGVDLVTMSLPAGAFLITAVATVRDESGAGDDQVLASCRLRNGAFAALPLNDGYVDIGEGQVTPGATVLIHGLLSFASSDALRFTCFGEGTNNKATNVTVTALKVGAVHLP
jgi:hypothetical protein